MDIYAVMLLPQGSASGQESNGQVLYRFYQEPLRGSRPHRQVHQPESHYKKKYESYHYIQKMNS